MVLHGTVRNVVDFGAFVDIGVHQDGLVHISRLSDGFVKRPGDVVSVGDVVEVAVIDAAALGSDFDGSVEVPWDASQLAVITQELMDRGYSEEDIAKIMGGNTVRVLGEVLPE